MDTGFCLSCSYSVCVTCSCVSCKAQKDAGECHIKIPVITFDSPEEEKEGEEAAGSEDDPTPKRQMTTSQSEEFHLCRETTSCDSTTLECPDPEQEPFGLQMTNYSTLSPQLTNDNSSSGIDVHSHPDDTDPLDPTVDSQGFLRIPPALGRFGPGGRTHIRGLSMDSGKDAVLLSDRLQNTVCWQLRSVSICVSYCHYLRQSVNIQTFVSLSAHHDNFQVRSGSQGGPDSQRIQLLGVCFPVGVS